MVTLRELRSRNYSLPLLVDYRKRTPRAMSGRAYSKRRVSLLRALHRRLTRRLQTLVDVVYTPLARWLEEDDGPRGGPSRPVSTQDIDTVFSNIDELVLFSRYRSASVVG